MKTLFLVVGRTVEPHFVAAIADYVGRIGHYTPFETEVIPELKNTRSLTQEQQKAQEGEVILKSLSTGDWVVLLDEHGKEYRSTELAAWLQRKQSSVTKRLVFVVGGPYGFSQAVYSRANEQLSLSRLTFSHQMVRLVFVEQLYRALTILNGTPYHHE